MKIAIIGAGAMGAMTGGRLAKLGSEVTLIDVWKEHIDKINSQGLLLRYKGDSGENIKIRGVYSAEELGETVDLVIVFVKGIYTEEAIKAAKSIIGPTTYVITLQNGVGNADIIAQHVNPAFVIIGTTTSSATLINVGEINDTTEVVNGQYTSHITPYIKNDNEKILDIADLFTRAGISTEVSKDAELAIWEKLAVNCCANATCMVTRLDLGTFSNDENGFHLQDKILMELVNVAQVKGIPLNYTKVRESVKKVFLNSTHHPSMAQDAYKKARTEIETITGAVVREGKRVSVATPVNETLYHLVRCVENNYEKLWY